MTTLYINKASGTFADTLLALGMADLMRICLGQLERPTHPLMIRDSGESFLIELPSPLREDDLRGSGRIAWLAPLKTAKQDERQAKKGRSFEGIEYFDYEHEQEKQRQLQEQLKKLDPKQRTPRARLNPAQELQQILSNGPRPELDHYKAINVMKVADTFNDLTRRWLDLSAEQQWFAIGLLFRLFSQPENDVEAAQTSWKKWAREQGIAAPPRPPRCSCSIRRRARGPTPPRATAWPWAAWTASGCSNCSSFAAS